MKRLLLITLFFLGLLVKGQSITMPSSSAFEANATAVDPGDIVINWPNNTDLILVSIGLDYIASGTTLSFPVTTGLTTTYGFNFLTGGITSINFYGVRDNVNAALAAMTLTMGSIKTAVKISVSAMLYDASYIYNATNQHFYKYVSSSGISYSLAKSNAAGQSFKGKTGYLLTITSQSENDFVNNNVSGKNIWLALTDSAVEGNWRIDAGPENGTLIKTANGQTTGNIIGQYNNWCTGEPNDSSGEDYAVTKWNGGTCWNDLGATSTSTEGYIVEFSKDYPSYSEYTGVYSDFVVHNSDMAYTLSSTNAINTSTISNTKNLFGGLQVNNGHTYTLPSATTLNSNKLVLNGTGKVVFTDATSKWTPGTSSTSNTITHSPSTNSTPTYWSVSSVWNYEAFGFWDGSFGHYTPWINSYAGWSVFTNDLNQYIILNYGTPAYITGIVTQGRQTSAQWVTKATIDVSMDKITWKTVLTNVAMNSDQTTLVNVLFPNVEYAQYVRVRPTEWYYHITMRLGLLVKQ